MKNLLALLLLLTTFSVNALAQSPTDDLPGDPGMSFQPGYHDGAMEANDLRMSLYSKYNGVYITTEWYSYSEENLEGHFGAPSTADDIFALPMIQWDPFPYYIKDDQQGLDRIAQLLQSKDQSEYDAGYYQGFYDQWYEIGY